MKKFVITVIFALIIFIGLTGCVGLNSRRLTLTEIKDSLKNDYNIEVSEIYGERDSEFASSSYYRSFRYDLDLFEWTDEGTAEAIVDKLEKWRYAQGGYGVLYCKTVGGDYIYVYFLSLAYKYITVDGEKIYGKVKDYLYVVDATGDNWL